MSAAPKLICMMGLPRSGKSTVARALSKALNAPVVNRDSIRLALHGKVYVASAELMVRATAKIMVAALFKAGHTVVIVDETNLKWETREWWRGGDWELSFLHIPTSYKECRRRAVAQDNMELAGVVDMMHNYAELLREDEVEYELSFDACEAATYVFLDVQKEGLEVKP